jgi:hypothetical protein
MILDTVPKQLSPGVESTRSVCAVGRPEWDSARVAALEVQLMPCPRKESCKYCGKCVIPQRGGCCPRDCRVARFVTMCLDVSRHLQVRVAVFSLPFCCPWTSCQIYLRRAAVLTQTVVGARDRLSSGRWRPNSGRGKLSSGRGRPSPGRVAAGGRCCVCVHACQMVKLPSFCKSTCRKGWRRVARPAAPVPARRIAMQRIRPATGGPPARAADRMVHAMAAGSTNQLFVFRKWPFVSSSATFRVGLFLFVCVCVCVWGCVLVLAPP